MDRHQFQEMILLRLVGAEEVQQDMLATAAQAAAELLVLMGQMALAAVAAAVARVEITLMFLPVAAASAF